MRTKICWKCKKEKLLSEFHKDKRNKDGTRYLCKKCFSKWHKQYYQKNREKIIKQTKEYTKNNPIRSWCIRTIAFHRSNGYKVLFNSLKLLPIAKQTKNCCICGNSLNWNYGKKGKVKSNSPSLDRINNDKILTLDKILIICHKCNVTKQDRNLKEFKNYCKLVVKNLEKI